MLIIILCISAANLIISAVSYYLHKKMLNNAYCGKNRAEETANISQDKEEDAINKGFENIMRFTVGKESVLNVGETKWQ